MFLRVGLLFLGLVLLPIAVGAEETFVCRGKEFRVLRADPAQVRMVWASEDGRPLATFQKAREKLLTEEKGTLKLLTNGGIFEPGNVPSGLYVERGKVERPLNLRGGKGNFYLKPNGVFFVKKKEGALSAGVVASDELAKWTPRERASLWYAVQSGPLLLRKGKVHPAFNEGSRSELLRNGVGVDGEGKVVFVITKGGTRVNLWTLAECFRLLGCEDALFLDGVISRMASSPNSRVKGSGFASMIGVME